MFLVLLTLWEILETMIIPRTATRRFRPTAIYYRLLGAGKSRFVHPLRVLHVRESLLAAFGPLSVLILVVLWSTCIILGFAAMQWGLYVPLRGMSVLTFYDYLYFSGTSFFTLGLGDLSPGSHLGRFFAVTQAGLGFGLLAAVIGYLPTLYQAFSARESFIVRIQYRCGGTIDGYALLGNFLRHGDVEGLALELRAFEEWTANLLEATESYPMLAFYRSQHSLRSWVGMLVAGLDACAALRIPCEPPWPPRLVCQAEASFSLGKRALETLAETFQRELNPADRRSLDFEKLQRCFGESVVCSCDAATNEAILWEIAAQYEPQAISLARFLALELP